MKIKKINHQDFDDLFKLWELTKVDIASKKREKQEIELVLKYNPNTCLKIDDKGKIIGSILGAFNGKRGWIHHLAIHPDYQKKGYGSLLLNTVENKLKKKGMTKVLLYVSYTNLGVVPFYEKNKYNVMNDSIIMRKDLWKENKKGGVNYDK